MIWFFSPYRFGERKWQKMGMPQIKDHPLRVQPPKRRREKVDVSITGDKSKMIVQPSEKGGEAVAVTSGLDRNDQVVIFAHYSNDKMKAIQSLDISPPRLDNPSPRHNLQIILM
ncbi:hypothetical protein TNIN_380751 [Trichonephila inaurata madagascariensis]|uniref:Uncharacterized protein n=1 Tax=Trichonephila inaurata madagascariensis TaxID=2747483 RepID=A0A8X6XGG3_9ARAC|nr:hypothetical protein TNIN_380751 [Trichonephila inaurata madagascariensis]